MLSDQQNAALVHIREALRSLNESWALVEKLAGAEERAVEPAIKAMIEDVNSSADIISGWCEDFVIASRR